MIARRIQRKLVRLREDRAVECFCTCLQGYGSNSYPRGSGGAGSMTLSRLARIRDRRHCADLLLSSTGQQYLVILHLDGNGYIMRADAEEPALTIPYELARLRPMMMSSILPIFSPLSL